ncbi:MEDS domain-containing protein [Pseudonocardia sp. H11422]|uniref:MEDS domain-containing protein n=1 Tax=Pseudonocardia sp. H11422 TaxID=2835866 RepID=UPI001BDD7287|nr:MEDS domain-containing protein [Pseudonocardia sp. H11422]
MTRWVEANPVVGLCLYDLDLFDGDVLVPMIKGHPTVWLDGAVITNPYHLRPEKYDTAADHLVGS